jgi:hypothetical protein
MLRKRSGYLLLPMRLYRTALRSGNQWQSMAIGGNRWQSVAISGHQCVQLVGFALGLVVALHEAGRCQ